MVAVPFTDSMTNIGSPPEPSADSKMLAMSRSSRCSTEMVTRFLY
jgi:hypothetical protein